MSSTGVSVTFVSAEGRVKNLLAEAEVHFHDGPMAGMKLVGFSIWTGERGKFATFPSRAFGAGTERRYFDFLRLSDGVEKSVLYGFKDWLVEQYENEMAEGGVPAPVRSERTDPDGRW